MSLTAFSLAVLATSIGAGAAGAILGLACVFAVIWITYRHELRTTMAPQAMESVTVHYPLMTKTLVVVAVMLVAFLIGVPVALVAISGAAYSLLTRRVNPEKVYREIAMINGGL